MSSKSGGPANGGAPKRVLMKRSNENVEKDKKKGQAPTLLRDGQPIPGQAWNPQPSRAPSQKIKNGNLDYRYPENRYYENRSRDNKGFHHYVPNGRVSREEQQQQQQQIVNGMNKIKIENNQNHNLSQDSGYSRNSTPTSIQKPEKQTTKTHPNINNQPPNPKSSATRKRSMKFIDSYARRCDLSKILDGGIIEDANTDFLVVGVVGLAASGKSTIASGLCGFDTPVKQLVSLQSQRKQKYSAMTGYNTNSATQFKPSAILDALASWERKIPFKVQQSFTKTKSGRVEHNFKSSSLGMRPQTTGIDIYARNGK